MRALIVLMLSLAWPVFAQPPTQAPAPTAANVSPAAPALTDVQKLQIVNTAQEIELQDLRAVQACAPCQAARARMQQLLAAFTPAGYQVTDKLELVKIEPKK